MVVKRQQETFEPVTWGHIRSHDCRDLLVYYCIFEQCHHSATLNGDWLPDETPVRALPFDPVTDFTPISMIATVPSLLVGNPALPAQDLATLIALAKAKPDTLSIAIGGIGSSLDLAGEQLKLMADVRILNVP
jgi:hypothetical protein